MSATVLTEHSADTLFREHSGDVLTYVRCLVGNSEDAADLTQDAFARAFVALRNGHTTDSNVRGWLFRIARNVALDHLRRQKILGLFVRYDQAETIASSNDRAAAIATWAVVDQLPPLWREAVVLRYRWRFTPAEIAKLQGKSDGAVRAELSRALARLARDLGKD